MLKRSKATARILIVFITIGGVYGEFKFTAGPWVPGFRQVYEKSDETINCSTNDFNATVSLLISNGAEYQDAEMVFGNRLSRNGQQFTLSVEKGDGRLFKCEAKNSMGDTISLGLGQLFVTPSPQQVNLYLIPNVKVRLVEQGGYVNITCEAVGAGASEKPRLTWYRDIQGVSQPVAKSMVHHQFLIKSRTENLVLIIRNADQTIAGTYTCVREESNVRTSRNIEIKLEAVTAPVVKLLDYSGNITVRERQGNVLVTCLVSGSPRPQRAWFFKGKVFAVCPELITDKCYLQIPRPTFEDQGIYSCVARNINGTASASVRLQVLVPVSLEKPGSKIYYGLHQPVDLYCIVKRANPLPRLSWRYQPYPCKVDEDCDPKGPWEPIPQTNQIFPAPDVPTNQSILKVGASEQSSFYSCLANNSIASDVYSFSLLRIENPPLQFSISPMNPKVNEYDDVSLACDAQFNIFDETSWLKDGQALSDTINRTRQQTGSLWKDVLWLGSVQISDEGNYTCIGRKRQGGTVLRHSFLYVEALRKPAIYNFVDQRAFESNVSVLIRCNTSGNPEPVLRWRFNTQMFRATSLIDSSRCADSTSGLYFIQGEKRRRLVICKPSYETHAGNYTCEANNTLGFASETKKLDIFAPPSISGWDYMVRYVPIRELVLTCRSRGNPAPSIKWYKVSSEKVLVEIPVESYSNSTAQVRIASSTQDAEGNYTCVAFNTLGVERKTLQVSTEDPIVKEAEKRVAVGIIASAVVVPVLAVLLLCLVYVLWYRRRLEKQYVSTLQTGKKFTLDPNKSLMEQSGNLPYDPAFEFPRERLNMLRTAGSGAYGQVWVAEAYGMARFKPRDRSAAAAKERKKLQGNRRRTFVAAFHKERSKSTFFDEEEKDKMQVAVKMLKEEATDDELRDLASELKIMIHLGSHKNLVNLLGACTKTPELLIILEYCPHGNLLSFLKERRSIFEPDWYKLQKTMAEELTYIDLMQAAHGVSRGMEYLSLRKCIHRDLAARNILISEDYTVKISDFGLARDVEKKDYYRKTTSGLLPIKWMAPESLFNQVYTDKTDVWSFGILLWEIFTLGGSPYPGVPASGLYEFLAEGGRMNQPDLCPDTVFEIMMECWEEDPKDRPSFTYLLDRLEGVMHDYIKKEADIITPDGYMAPQDGPELQKLRESRRKFAQIRANPEKEELSPHSIGNNVDDSLGDSPQVARAVKNSYVELRRQDSLSSNETCL